MTEELKYFVENFDKKIELAKGQLCSEVLKLMKNSHELIDSANF